MEDLVLYIWMALGVLASLVLPLIWKKAFPGTPPPGFTTTQAFWKEAKTYAWIAGLSLVLGLVAFTIVKQTSGKFDHWYSAFLNGYFWDATLQKFKK